MQSLGIPRVREARRSEWDEVADILGDAFSEDPLLKWICDHAEYPQFNFELTLSSFGRHEGVLIDESKNAACLFIRPNRKMPNIVKPLPILRGIRRFGISPLFRGLQFLSAAEKHHFQLPHVYIFAIGARRSMQGTGLGAAVMKELIKSQTPTKTAIYLENSNPKNGEFYKKFGFQEVEDFMPGKRRGPVITTMLRP